MRQGLHQDKNMRFLLLADTHTGHTFWTDQIHREFYERLKTETFGCLIHAGDWAGKSQDDFLKGLETLREFFPDIPIVTVRGNHDFWCMKPERIQFKDLQEKHGSWFKKFSIHHLEQGSFIINNVQILGFDGWYATPKPPSCDEEYMPPFIESIPVHYYMIRRAHQEFQRIRKEMLEGAAAGKTIIVVTHFPIISASPDYNCFFSSDASYGQELLPNTTIFCHGHTHKQVDIKVNESRIINPGSDYDKPRGVIFGL
jgi:predicted phosphodiesterase